jgi:hypothetical protein
MLVAGRKSSWNQDADVAIKVTGQHTTQPAVWTRMAYFEPPGNLVFLISDVLTSLGPAGDRRPIPVSHNGRNLSGSAPDSICRYETILPWSLPLLLVAPPIW